MDYFVATAGDDGNTGTSLDSPLSTLQKAVNLAVAGDTIYVRGGVYREQVTAATGGGVAGSYLTITAYQDERPVFKGSDLVTGWQLHEGAIWKKTGWTIPSQQVFCNEQWLQQIGLYIPGFDPTWYTTVGTGLADLYPGSFYHDATAATLYVWLSDGGDPNAAVMEASTRPSAFSSASVSFVDIRGLSFRHSTSVNSLVSIGPDSLIKECDIQWGGFAGLGLWSRSTALNCIISNNGDTGVGANTVDDICVRGCVINGNNYRNFNRGWHAGGLKFIPDVSGIVEDCEISDNNGQGVWFDTCNSGRPIIIRNNRLRGNADTAIFVEISGDALVCNNLLIGNSLGIYSAGSNNVRIYHNTVIGTRGYASIAVAPRGAGFTLKNNQVLNNIVFGNTCLCDLIIPKDNGEDIGGNNSDYNCFFRSQGTMLLSTCVQSYSSLETWQSGSGFDQHSVSVDPQFTDPDHGDFSTLVASGVVDAGVTLAEVAYDIRGVSRPQGVASDMGAYETSGQDTEPPTLPQNLAVRQTSWNSFLVTWSHVSDNVGVARYVIYRDGLRIGGCSATSFTDTGLTPETHYAYSVSALDAAGNESGLSETLHVTTLAKLVFSTIGQWRAAYFGSSEDSGTAANAFDSDHDGSPNLMEYSLGRDPLSGVGADGSLGLPHPEIDRVADRLVFVMDLPSPTPSDVVYEVWASDDLQNWTCLAQKPLSGSWGSVNLPVSIIEGQVLSERQIIKVYDSESLTGKPRRMMNLRVSVPH